MIEKIRNYWKVYLLSFLLMSSVLVLFSPALPLIDVGATENAGDNASIDEKYTGLTYGIELAGGTRISAPLHGYTAEGVDIGEMSASEAESAISSNIDGVNQSDVIYREPQDQEADSSGNSTVEVTSKSGNKTELKNALRNEGIEYDSVRSGVTEETRERSVDILQNKISESGLSGGSVRTVDSADDGQLILIQIPDTERDEAIDLITKRGDVRVDIYYPTDNGSYDTQKSVLEEEDFRTIGAASRGEQGQGPHVPVSLTDKAAQKFENQTVETGVARPGGSTCQYDRAPNETQACLLTVVDGEVIYSAGMAPSLAGSVRSGEWSEDPSFILQTEDYDEARSLAVNLRGGTLPTPVDVDSGEVTFVASTQGESFKFTSLLVGIISMFAVATVVGLRYGDLRIAVPMLGTAFSEVIILFAVAALLSYPIDLAVIAGFVAVLGTGVDDLIIIADRVIGGSNPAKSSRIFRNRFRKALWVILSAAGTTILALGPLAVLDLQQIQGFAIFTIIGVVIGVVFTRPAYGDVLSYLFTEN